MHGSVHEGEVDANVEEVRCSRRGTAAGGNPADRTRTSSDDTRSHASGREGHGWPLRGLSRAPEPSLRRTNFTARPQIRVDN